MKTYAPKALNGAMLRDLLDALVCTPAQAAKFLRVTERSVFRWLADGSAPFAVLAALWHETPEGRHVTALDVGNELAIHAGLARSNAQALAKETGRLAYVVRLGDFGCANDPIYTGPAGLPGPRAVPVGFSAGRGGPGGLPVRSIGPRPGEAKPALSK